MYAVEFRVISTPQERAPLRQTGRVDRTNEVAKAVDAPKKKEQPIPVVKDEANSAAREEARRQQMEEILEHTAGADRYLRFEKHEKTGQWMVRVCDSETDEVIKEIPPEKILDMVSRFCELAGLLVDEKV
mgnify:CR=1 FL=1